MVDTIAVKLPTEVGFVVKVTVSDVAVATVTVPTAPLLRTTALSAATVLKPNPWMVKVVASARKSEVLPVTTGFTVAT